MENYLINPINPFETLRIPGRTERVWREGKNGRFGKLAGHARKASKIRTKKRKAASAKRFKSVIGIVKKEKHMNPLMLINKHRKALRKSARKAKVVIANKRRSHKRRSVKRRALVVMNPMRHRSIRRSRRFHHNPMMPKFLGRGMVGEAGKLVLVSAAMFGGYKLGTWVMDQASAKVPVFNQPIVRALVHVGLGYGAYKLASRVKAIPAPVATALGAAIMMPGIITAWDSVRGMIGGPSAAPKQVAYAPEETAAYVPEGTGAFVPGMGEAYGSTY